MGNFMTAKTEIDGLINDQNKINDDIARIIANTAIEKLGDSNASEIMRDIEKILKDMEIDQQNAVLRRLLVILMKRGKFSKTNNDARRSKSSDFGSIFGSRGL